VALTVLVASFFLQRGHVGVALIQLEFISLLALFLLLFNYFEVRLKTISLFLLFCVIASEAALGLSFLVSASRQRRGELEKFSI